MVGVAEAALEAGPDLPVDGLAVAEAELHEGGGRVGGVRLPRVCVVAQEVADEDKGRGAIYVDRVGFALGVIDGVAVEADGDGGVGAVEPFDGGWVVWFQITGRFEAGAFDSVAGAGGGGRGGAEYHLEVLQVACVFAW